MKTTLALCLLIALTATTAKARPPLIHNTPAYRNNHYYNYYRGYLIQPYAGQGGYKHYHPTRKAWTNYRTPDTSWGYKTRQPTQSSLGIPPGHQNTHPNPRSLYH